MEFEQFSFEREQGADKMQKQLLLVGASNVNNACYNVGKPREEKTALYFYCKPGSNLQEYAEALEMLFKQPEMLADTFNECPDHPEPRQLNLCIWLTLNDIGRSYFTQDCMYLTRMLARIHAATEAFSKVSKRKVKLAFLPYFHAPVIFKEHQNVDKFNDTVRHVNSVVLNVKTYDLDVFLVKKAKAGEAEIVRIDGVGFASPNENWRPYSGIHIQDHKLAEVMSDIRLYMKDDFTMGLDKPKKMEIQIKLGSKPLKPKEWPAPPKWATARAHRQYAARNAAQPRDNTLYAKVTTKRNGTSQEKQQAKFARPATRERTLSAEKVKLRHQATQKAIEDAMSHVPDDIQGDKRWESLLNKSGHQADDAKETEDEQDQVHKGDGLQEEKETDN